MRKLLASGLLSLSLVCLPGLVQAEEMESMPIAKQIGPLEQVLSVGMVPVEIVMAMTFALNESYVEGRTYEGDYARHGYLRTHARWWDPFTYYHE